MAADGVAAWLQSLEPKLLWFAGKGGVGKSTCAAAVAAVLSHTRQVLLCSTDPAGSQQDVLGADSERAMHERAAEHGLRVLQVDAAAGLEAWKARYRAAADRIFSNLGVGGDATLDHAIVSSLWEAVPPGIDELFSLSEILDAAETGETVIVDSAPTGHFLRLVATPELALEWVHAIMRILLKYGVAGALDDFTEGVLAFARQLKDLRARLLDPSQCGIFVVTMQEQMVEAETERLLKTLELEGLHTIARIVNRSSRSVQRTVSGDVARSTTLVAPLCSTPPIGLQQLEAFAASWQFA
jgi:arsenite-transporting ATPase